MPVRRPHSVEHLFFLLSVWIKGLAGLVESAAGLVVFWIAPQRLAAIAQLLTAPELSEDPDDRIAQLIHHSAQHYSVSTQSFASAYLVVHGLIKLALVAGLLRRQLWAYPLSLWFLAMFVVYQLYRFASSHSIWMLLLSVLDVVVAVLIWREYQWCRQPQPRNKAAV